MNLHAVCFFIHLAVDDLEPFYSVLMYSQLAALSTKKKKKSNWIKVKKYH